MFFKKKKYVQNELHKKNIQRQVSPQSSNFQDSHWTYEILDTEGNVVSTPGAPTGSGGSGR